MNPDIINIKRPWTNKASIWFAVGSLLAGIIIFAIAYLGTTNNSSIGVFNQPILDYMMSSRTTNLTDTLSTITILGSLLTIGTITISIAVIWASYKREFWRPILLVFAMALTAATTTLLKTFFMVNRPPIAGMILPIETDFAFPSGHALSVVALALVIGYLICSRRSSTVRIIFWATVTLLTTAIIAFSRLYLGYHWFTDVIGSVGIGFIILSLVIFIDKITAKRFTKLK